MTFAERIEAAAKAMVKLGASRRAAGKQIPTRFEEAQAALLAAYPELHSWTGAPPQAWLAPWDASAPMRDAGKRAMEADDLEPTHTEIAVGYASMRTAHLAKDQE